MAHLDLTTATYAAAQSRLHGRSSVRIGHNTTLHTYSGPAVSDAIAVRYHATDIVTVTPDGWLTMDTRGWYTVTTWARINALLPAPWRIGSVRTRGVSNPWLHAGGYPVTPYVDGLAVHTDGSVGFGGGVLLTPADVATIRTAAEADRVTRDAKRAARLLAQHPIARDLPDASEPGPHRGYDGRSYDCARCTAERATIRAHDRARMAAEHPNHPDRWTGLPMTSCPWDCPNR